MFPVDNHDCYAGVHIKEEKGSDDVDCTVDGEADTIRTSIKTEDFGETSIPRTHKCPYCTFEVDVKRVLELHVLAAHDTAITTDSFRSTLTLPIRKPITSRSTKKTVALYQCDQCSYASRNKIYLRVHKITEHPDLELNRSTPIETNSQGPLNEVIEIKTFDEAIEIKTEPMADEYVDENLKIEDSDTYHYMPRNSEGYLYKTSKQQLRDLLVDPVKVEPVETCLFETDTKPTLNFLKSHDMGSELKIVKEYKCGRCPYKTERKQSWARHRNNNHKPGSGAPHPRFPCKLCPHVSKRRFDLEKHLIRKHTGLEDVAWFKCPQCEYKAKRKFTLDQHVALKHHEGQEKYRCTACSFVTNTWNNLKSHVLHRHTKFEEVQLFDCSLCPYKTKIRYCLKRHERNKHAELCPDVSWFYCNSCPYMSKRACDVKKHVTSRHTTLEQMNGFLCDKCPFVTKRMFCLSQHILRKHAEVTPGYPCPDCSYRGKTNKELRSHVFNKHTKVEEEEYFRCEFCAYKTKTKYCLKRHFNNVHDKFRETNRFPCVMCGYAAGFKCDLKKHMLRRHNCLGEENGKTEN